MAIPHYTYLVLKMPSSRVLALWANLSIAYASEIESLALAEATNLSIQMASVVTDAKMVPADDLEIPALEPPRAFAKSKEMKEVGLSLKTPPRPLRLGLTSTPNRKSRSSPSYVRTPTCLLGNLQT